MQLSHMKCMLYYALFHIKCMPLLCNYLTWNPCSIKQLSHNAAKLFQKATQVLTCLPSGGGWGEGGNSKVVCLGRKTHFCWESDNVAGKCLERRDVMSLKFQEVWDCWRISTKHLRRYSSCLGQLLFWHGTAQTAFVSAVTFCQVNIQLWSLPDKHCIFNTP